MQYAEFRDLLLAGRGPMPAFPSLEDGGMRALWQFMTGTPAQPQPRQTETPPPLPEGPVVASGGAPGGLEPRPRPQGGPRGAPYPSGVEAPKVRYYTPYGLSFPYIMKGRWSQITAYDLNTGDIRWQTPLGVDRAAAALGASDVGVPRGGLRMAMIVTSTGLIFATAKDGAVRAYDANTGSVLWTGRLPRGAEGLPAMYRIDGRQYLVVSASTNLTFGRAAQGSGPWTAEDGVPDGPSAYVVFALPGRGASSNVK
jgi:quinoprotein glucose dehydrogenase